MGLDMYLTGHKFLWTDWDNPENNLKEDGYRVSERLLDLGYWRKHPDLHGYIVQTFAGGKDECQDIFLSAGNLEQILKAVNNDELPHTEGFFFGQSQPEDKDFTIKILKAAINWVKTEEQGVSRSVVYHASW